MIVSKCFDPDEYYDYMSNMDIKTVSAELKKINDEIVREEEEQKIHKKLLDNHFDDPAYEHLLEMSIVDNNGRDDLINIDRRKVSILERIIEEKAR